MLGAVGLRSLESPGSGDEWVSLVSADCLAAGDALLEAGGSCKDCGSEQRPGDKHLLGLHGGDRLGLRTRLLGAQKLYVS